MELTEALIDTSEHQGAIDFDVCYAAGIRHAIPRAGINARLDFTYVRSVAGYRKAGIGVPAAYWFMNPKSSSPPELQGRTAARACLDHEVRTMMMDLEWYETEGGPNPVLKGQAYVDWVERWMQAFISVDSNLQLMVYTSPAFWNPYAANAHYDPIAELDTIIASYKWQSGGNDPIAQGVHPTNWQHVVKAKSQPLLPSRWDGTLEGWQFSAGYNKQGPVYGMRSSDLDLNVVNRDALLRWYGDKPYDPKPDPLPKPLPPTTPTGGVTYEEDKPMFRVMWPEGWVFEIIHGTKRAVEGGEFYWVLHGSLQNADGSYKDGFGNPVVPNPVLPIAYVGDRDQILALPDYVKPATAQDVSITTGGTAVDTTAVAKAVRNAFREDPLK